MRLSTLDDTLRPCGQRLVLDPPGDPTVGACLAANLSGPLRHRFGTLRDLVLGVTLVLPDGTIVNAGGKVVKNVAGYDLGKLVCGSRGMLALIARVSLRLHPLPTAASTVVVKTDDPAGVAGRLLRAELVPSALDILYPGRVAMLFEGSDEAVTAQVARAAALVGAAPSDDRVWQESRERQAVSCGTLRFPPGELRAMLEEVDQAVVRVAAGVGYVPFEVPSDTPAAERALQERVRARFDPAGTLA